MEETLQEGTLFSSFNKYEEFSTIQLHFLDLCSRDQGKDGMDEAEQSLKKLIMILAEYQEQAYLLDPFLDRLVVPAVEQLKTAVVTTTPTNHERIGLLAELLYQYIIFRGYKAITRFFPHEIADLSIVLTFFQLPDGPTQKETQWPLRYVTLLWLSMICMLPFDLAQFDEPESIGKTAADLQAIARAHLDKAGTERQGAAILLSRLYARKDMNAEFPAFLIWTSELVSTANGLFASIGALQVLCELAKSAPAAQVQPHIPELFRIVAAVNANTVLTNNTVIRKMRIKLESRAMLRLLPAKRSNKRSKGKALRPEDGNATIHESEEVDDIDVPEEVEDVLQDLFTALQDKDTVVRYSTAKAVARISEHLPSDFSEQVLDNVLQLFTVHSIGAASLYDMPAIAEATWHGTSMTCAEMARRGLIPEHKLGELIDWMRKALYFDIRKGSHSVGSSVRDAASYVLWSLARAQSVESLAPYATGLAQTLVTVSCFDREIHIRRAASAAFQEFVGRTSLFPHGIDVLRKTDFYAVGTRRNAFTVVAPEVAEHEIYQGSLLDHLLGVTIRHWDPVMRRLAAQSIRNICQLDLWRLGQTCVEKVTPLLSFSDTSDIHGALVTLTELAMAYEVAEPKERVELKLREIFSLLNRVPQKMLQSYRNELIVTSACQIIAHSITLPEIELKAKASVPHWRSIIDFAMKSTAEPVQISAADALASVSHLTDISSQVERFIREAKSGSPALQQSVCRMLGVLDYMSYPAGLLPAVNFLVESVDRSAPTALENVEARRNAYYALPQIIENVLPRIEELLPSEIVARIFTTLIAGLEDYSTDQRGDVGSWIRIACVKGIADFSTSVISNAPSIRQAAEYLPSSRYQEAIAGVLKQGVERLDNVRQQAGVQFLRLLSLSLLPQAINGWRMPGETLIRELFLGGANEVGWNEGAWLFPRVVRLLAIHEYRHAVLAGLVFSVGSKTDSTQRPVSASLVDYASTLPVRDEAAAYDLNTLVTDLLTQAKSNLPSNTVVVPVLQTFNVLLEADAFEELTEDTEGLKSLQSLLSICSRNVSRLKNVLRILASMKVVVNCLNIPPLRNACASHLPSFLGHQYPKIRLDTAVTIYFLLQGKDINVDAADEVDQILLETEWGADNMDAIRAAAERCANLMMDSDLGQ